MTIPGEILLGLIIGICGTVVTFLFGRLIYLMMVSNIRRNIEKTKDQRKECDDEYKDEYKEMIIEAFSEYERRKNESSS